MLKLRTSVSLDIDRLLPAQTLFDRESMLHGRKHVGRVMILGFLLIELTSSNELEIPLWAATYVHDLARQHDGSCQDHGRWAIEMVRKSSEIQGILKQGGLHSAQWPMVETAVVHHCRAIELDDNHPHFRLASLLKDADGLDRVRLGDLDPSFLRHKEAITLIPFAEKLLLKSRSGSDQSDPKLMSWLWDRAVEVIEGIKHA